MEKDKQLNQHTQMEQYKEITRQKSRKCKTQGTKQTNEPRETK